MLAHNFSVILGEWENSVHIPLFSTLLKLYWSIILGFFFFPLSLLMRPLINIGRNGLTQEPALKGLEP